MVTILDANGADYDLSGKDLEFCERKVSSKVVVDDGTDQDSDKGGKFELDADNKGTFTYTLPRQAYAASGTCWFTIKQGDSVIDTTKDFYLDVDDEASINLSDDNYASSFEAQLTYYKSLYSKANDTLNADHQQYVDGLNEYKQNFDDLKAQWTKQTADIQTAANQQIADAKKAASDQLASDTQAAKDQRDSEASTFNSTLQDQVKQIESARDAAIQDANDAYKAQRDQLASDFANWQKTEHDSFVKTLADIQTHIDQLQNTDLPGMDVKVKDLQAKIAQAEQDAQNATAKFNSIDITKYELKSDLANDYYNKAQADSLLAQAGKLKSVSVNGGSKVQPDSSGNADLTIPKQDMSDYYTKTDIDSKVNVDGPLYKDLKQLNNWSDLFDDYAHSMLTVTIGRLVAFRDDTNGSNTVGSFGSGIAFGGGDTSGVLSIAPFSHQARITAGNADNHIWSEDIAWKSDITNLMSMQQTLQTTVSSNQTDIATIKNTLADIKTKTDALDGSMLVKSCTQAQYDAMTDEQKKSAAWMISDS